MTDLILASRWTWVALVALAAAGIAMVARRVLRATLHRLARGAPLVRSMLHATEQPGAALFPLLPVLLVLQDAPADLPFLGAVGHLTVLALIGTLTWFTVALIAFLAREYPRSLPVARNLTEVSGAGDAAAAAAAGTGSP